jgi:hypothetical protein
VAYVSLLKDSYVNLRTTDGNVYIGFVVGDNQSGILLQSTDVVNPQHLFIPWGSIHIIMPEV